jgi:uncharacterized repeat protein (TIGR01451 family)
MKKLVALTIGLLAAVVIVVSWVSEVKAASVTLTLTINRIVEVDCDEEVGEACANDYYPKVDIGAQGLDDAKERYCCAHGTSVDPNWVFSRTVDDGGPVPIHIELWDQDDASDDDELDISTAEYRSLDISVNFQNCTWEGSGAKGFLNTTGSSAGTDEDAARVFIYVNAPSANCQDTDNDGLLDRWEDNGYDVDNDGTPEINLKALGADKLRKDLFLELDYIQAGANHTHAPVQPAIQALVQAFANAPITNNDGSTGIQLHVDVGPLYGVGVTTNVTGTAGATPVTGNFGDFGGGGSVIPETATGVNNTVIDFDGAAGNPGTNFFTLRGANFNSVRDNIYRYTIFGHQTNARRAVNDCTSGQAFGIPGVNFMVTLGGLRNPATPGGAFTPCWTPDPTGNSVGSQGEQAGTLMHEFGHVIGLQHGGNDGFNNKPNYLSVMNYTFQACSVTNYGVLSPGGCDFSRLAIPPGTSLSESGLDECRGIDSGALGAGPTDFNGNGQLEGASNCQPPNNANVPADINNDGATSILNGFQDWNAIVYNFRTVPDFVNAGSPTSQEAEPEDISRARTHLANMMRPGFAVDKTGPANARPGDTLSYNVKVENQLAHSGRGPAMQVGFTDTKPDLTTQAVTIGTLALQRAVNTAISYAVPCSTADGTVLTNSVLATATDVVGNVITKADSVTTTIQAPVLTLTKTATASVNAGEAITYTITYANTGSGAAANVSITDTLPADVYYSVALDLGAGPKPNTVTLNANGTRTLVWNVGTLAGNSGSQTIEFTARPTLLALGGATFTNSATLSFQNENGCVYDSLTQSATTSISVVAATLDPQGKGYWRAHPEIETSEVLARVQATDQRWDVSGTPGALSLGEVATALTPGGNFQLTLGEQLIALYFNLATRRVNAGTPIASKLDTQLGLTNVREAALFAIDTMKLPVISASRPQYSDATNAVEEINLDKSVP